MILVAYAARIFYFKGMASLFFRNLFFIILQPGTVCFLLPWLIAKEEIRLAFTSPVYIDQYLGIMLFSTGLFILLYCVYHFAVYGKGTLSPADPTKRLVVKGLYRYSRNPMYAGILLMLLGESIFFRSSNLGIYAFVVFVLVFIYVVYFEEPRLMKDFGPEYQAYRKRVRRWL